MNFKKNIILLFLLCIVNSLTAQDTITLKNGLTIHGLITEIKEGQIKFRIDGGSVGIDQVINYSKSGQKVSVNENSEQQKPITNASTNPSECERRNTGDVEFENKSKYGATVRIFALGLKPENPIYGSENNPIIATISVPSGGKMPAFDLTAGTHYITYEFIANQYSGQIRITKCGKYKMELYGD